MQKSLLPSRNPNDAWRRHVKCLHLLYPRAPPPAPRLAFPEGSGRGPLVEVDTSRILPFSHFSVAGALTALALIVFAGARATDACDGERSPPPSPLPLTAEEAPASLALRFRPRFLPATPPTGATWLFFTLFPNSAGATATAAAAAAAASAANADDAVAGTNGSAASPWVAEEAGAADLLFRGFLSRLTMPNRLCAPQQTRLRVLRYPNLAEIGHPSSEHMIL